MQDRVDLVLAYPQWQGSGRPDHLPRGATAAEAVCAGYGPVARVPVAAAGETGEGINRWTAILQQFEAARAILHDRQPARILTAGGDCACDVAVIDYLHRRYPDLQVVWVDAHLDANTAATSPSGNFHGMPVATLLGAPPPSLVPLLGSPLRPDRFHYAGVQAGDDGEWAFQREQGLGWFDPEQPLTGPVHVHFDLDALDPAEFPHVAFPDGRMAVAEALAMLRAVAGSATLVGLTVTEFAPADATAAAQGSQVLRQLCEAALGAG